MVLRFANHIFSPIWERNVISNVQISFKEELGVEGRGGYFDHYGIIRDVMQNHLMQILALIAMEQPVSLSAEDVRDEKVKVLRCINPLDSNNLVIGQYKATKDGKIPAYNADPTVEQNSLTPTYAAAVLFINNYRWDGVPFLLRCGKAMDSRKTEIRIQFKDIPANIFKYSSDDIQANELVIRVQPDEAIYFKIMNKIPGLSMEMDVSLLDLQYKSNFQVDIPDAYERLILDVVRGDKSLFIRNDELQASWNIFTPVLHEIEQKKNKTHKIQFS